MHDATREDAGAHGLSSHEWTLIGEILGRPPNAVELGIFSVMWSEHCSYKSSKKHLSRLPTEAPWVVQGPGENAGVVDIGDGQVAVFKMESHNHPSFIEPYQGAATGVGGILRDVFTMGARPVALMNALRFGDPRHPRTKHLVQGVVAGIGGYGNCVGVPTVGGEATFHKSYDGNILVNAMAIGVADKDRVFYAKASGSGNPIVYFGAKTGRDGIHGATMASSEFSEAKAAARPTVQVGDPFTEKLLIEACLELMTTDAVVAIQDMGAAGLTSSSFEMASKGGCGVEMDLDAVPVRETGMSAYEIMLSESQERMLCVLEAGREAEAEAIFAKWDLSFATVGRITDTGRMVIRMDGGTVADVPIDPVAGASPVYDRLSEPSPTRLPFYAERLTSQEALAPSLLRLVACPDLASKRWIWEQYDHTVMADTVQAPGGDAAVVRVHGTNKGLALTTDCTPRYVEADPYRGGMQAVAEAWRNLVSVGAEPLAITNCLNFGNPERPRVMGQLTAAIDGMANGLPRARLPRRLGQRLALQRDRRPRRAADAQRRRRRPDPRLARHDRPRVCRGRLEARPRRRVRRLDGGFPLSARGARPGRGRPADDRPRRGKAQRRPRCSPDRRAPRPSRARPRRRRPRRGAGRDVLGLRYRCRARRARGRHRADGLAVRRGAGPLPARRRPRRRRRDPAARAGRGRPRPTGRHDRRRCVDLGRRAPHMPRNPEGRARGVPARLDALGDLEPMPMRAEDIEAMIKGAIPDAEVRIEDLAGDGDHYRAHIVSPAFKGMPRVRQHQMVYQALGDCVGGELHALALVTSAPA